VGNALGEGVVIRDGLLTSMTAEEQDGRWKWLRFSAAASPGNSGGPLLDSRGRVVGIVTAKSPGENLNYALPIDRLQNGSAVEAAYDERESVGLPVLQATQVATLKAAFKLPASYAEFARRHRKVWLDHARAERTRLLDTNRDELFPKGLSARLLASDTRIDRPGLIVQDHDHSWVLREHDESDTVELPGEGGVEAGSAQGVGIFELRRPDEAADDAFYADSRAFMDLLLRGLNLTRQVGSQAVRIVSAGRARRDGLHTDGHGRLWQMRTWQFAHTDVALVIAALPTPDGYVGMIQMSPAMGIEHSEEHLKLLTGFFQTPLRGTLPQWHAYLARKPLRPATFATMRLTEDAGDVTLSTTRFRMNVPARTLKLADHAWLELEMGYLLDGGTLRWDPKVVTLAGDSEGESYVRLHRQARPSDGAGREAQQRWEKMRQRQGEFAGTFGRDSTTAVSATLALGPTAQVAGIFDAQSAALYKLIYRTTDRLLPREMEERRDALAQSIAVLEK
jgi:hypothetical protein